MLYQWMGRWVIWQQNHEISINMHNIFPSTVGYPSVFHSQNRQRQLSKFPSKPRQPVQPVAAQTVHYMCRFWEYIDCRHLGRWFHGGLYLDGWNWWHWWVPVIFVKHTMSTGATLHLKSKSEMYGRFTSTNCQKISINQQKQPPTSLPFTSSRQTHLQWLCRPTNGWPIPHLPTNLKISNGCTTWNHEFWSPSNGTLPTQLATW